MNDNEKIKQYQHQLNDINDEIDDEIENLKYLIDNVEIQHINFLHLHYKFNELLNKKDYIEKIIFNLKY